MVLINTIAMQIEGKQKGEVMLILVFYIIFIIIIFFATIGGYDNVAVTPRQIYECTNLNIFACTLIFIIAFVLDPLFFILHFIDWVMHFGRKEQ